MDWIRNVGMWVLAIALLIGGLVLAVVAVRDVVNGFKGSTKDFTTIIWGIVIGAVGVFFLYLSAENFISIFKGLADSVPKS